eukprot:56194-Chlamydomonas_euryale.AAC.5
MGLYDLINGRVWCVWYQWACVVLSTGVFDLTNGHLKCYPGVNVSDAVRCYPGPTLSDAIQVRRYPMLSRSDAIRCYPGPNVFTGGSCPGGLGVRVLGLWSWDCNLRRDACCGGVAGVLPALGKIFEVCSEAKLLGSVRDTEGCSGLYARAWNFHAGTQYSLRSCSSVMLFGSGSASIGRPSAPC